MSVCVCDVLHLCAYEESVPGGTNPVITIYLFQHIKAIIKSDSLVLLDSDHPAIQEFISELEVRVA